MTATVTQRSEGSSVLFVSLELSNKTSVADLTQVKYAQV